MAVFAPHLPVDVQPKRKCGTSCRSQSTNRSGSCAVTLALARVLGSFRRLGGGAGGCARELSLSGVAALDDIVSSGVHLRPRVVVKVGAERPRMDTCQVERLGEDVVADARRLRLVHQELGDGNARAAWPSGLLVHHRQKLLES